MNVDVLIPCRNAPQALWLCLVHLEAFTPWDQIASVTLLDNASTDAHMPDVFALAERFRVPTAIIHHERDVGVWCSLNRGLALARNSLVLVVTSDVLIGPGVINQLLDAQRATHLAFLCPDWSVGLGEVTRLAQPHNVHVSLAASEARPQAMALREDYNGACWLMDWSRLRPAVGWFDPRFYVTFGDVDYVERCRLAAASDPSLAPAVLSGACVCHLDKQSRRADMTAEEDTRMELGDGRRFRDKWRGYPAVLTRHRELPAEQYLNFKSRDLGGWKEAKIG